MFATKLMKIQWKSLKSACDQCRYRSLVSITSDAIRQQNELFTEEQNRQRDAIGRIEKIEIRYLGLPEDATLVMNRGISTPYNCAMHLSEAHCRNSALALLDGRIPWDMHRPLQDSCMLQLLNFNIADPHLVNKAFWRTCSFMLGAVLQNTLKEEANMQLHSFPGPNVRSGSFVYDIVLGQRGWQPTKEEMRTFSAEMIKMSARDLQIERLDVTSDLAKEIFKDYRYKSEQLPSIAGQNNGKVTLYRIGTHIDISRGPMIGSSNLLGKCTIAGVHEIAKKDSDDDNEQEAFYRIQGVALPVGFRLNYVAWEILEGRARKLNPARLPNEPFEESLSNGCSDERMQIA